MEIYSESGQYRLYQGNMLDMLDVIEPESVDSIVTDPPYELNFMNKGWDNSGVAFRKETWERCFRVLKSGGYLLAFGGSRTFHRIACAIEDAGFEIRDTIMWVFGSGFPKSMNIGLAIDKKNGVESEVVGKTQAHGYSNIMIGGQYEKGNGEKYTDIKQARNEWNGYGTQLKPAYEPVIVARKPCEGTIVENVLKHSVGCINIDECRVPFEDTPNPATNPLYRQEHGYKHDRSKSMAENSVVKFSTSPSEKPISPLGRFPANVILTYDDTDFDEVCGGFPNTNGDTRTSKPTYDKSIWGNGKSVMSNCLYNDSGSAARYFYCAKATRRDRDEGLERLSSKNVHPTVKPCDLMQYLVRLVTPRGGTVLDPFNGSGSTGKAVMYENRDRGADYKYIGIELTPEYLPIAKARIEYVCGLSEDELGVEERRDDGTPRRPQQMSLF